METRVVIITTSASRDTIEGALCPLLGGVVVEPAGDFIGWPGLSNRMNN